VTTLLENPMPVIFAGIAIEAVLAVALVKTGRGFLLYIMAGVLVVVLALVALERLVVTDRERVEMTLDRCAAALEADDLDALLDGIAPEADRTRSEARRAMEWIRFTRIKITDLTVHINELTSPPSARAEFRAVVAGRERRGTLSDITRPIRFHVDLRQEGDRWLITDHRLDDAPGGF
jgi:hypothetical protein